MALCLWRNRFTRAVAAAIVVSTTGVLLIMLAVDWYCLLFSVWDF